MGHAAWLGSASRLTSNRSRAPQTVRGAEREHGSGQWGQQPQAPRLGAQLSDRPVPPWHPWQRGNATPPARLPRTLSLTSSPRLLRSAPPPLAPRGPAQLCPGRVAVATGCSLVPDTQTHSSRAQGASAAKSLGRRKGGCVLREPGTPQNTSRLQGPFSYQPPLLKERTRAFFGGRGVIPLFFSPPVCKLETTTSAKALPRTVASLHPGAEAGPPGGRSAAGRAGSATPRLRPPPAVTATVCADRAGGEGASPGAARRWAAVLPLPAPSRSGGGTWLGRCLRPGEEVRCSAKG